MEGEASLCLAGRCNGLPTDPSLDEYCDVVMNLSLAAEWYLSSLPSILDPCLLLQLHTLHYTTYREPVLCQLDLGCDINCRYPSQDVALVQIYKTTSQNGLEAYPGAD